MLNFRALPALSALLSISFFCEPVFAQQSETLPIPAPFILDEPRIIPEIVGGERAGPGDNPFQVALLRKSDPTNATAQFCGGSLIAPKVIVTAAHCSFYQKTRGGPKFRWTADEVQVLTGTQSLLRGGVRHNVTQIIDHPKYVNTGHDYDVAVWKLETEASGSRFATLATSIGPTGELLLVTGWGATSSGGPSSPVLLKVSVPTVPQSICQTAMNRYGPITPRMVCAGFAAGGKDSCQGDSGGPASTGPENHTLTGIVSWGIGCANPNTYGVYTRVSDPEIGDFVRNNMK